MGLPPVTSTVLLIAKYILVNLWRLGGISVMPIIPLQGNNVSGLLKLVKNYSNFVFVTTQAKAVMALLHSISLNHTQNS
jgi:hypothetical protein